MRINEKASVTNGAVDVDTSHHDNTIRNNKVKLLSMLPLLVFIFGSLWYLPKFMQAGAISSSVAEGSVYRQLVFGLAYLLAGMSIFRNMRYIFPLIIEQWLSVMLLVMVLGSAIWSAAAGKVLINFVHLSGAFLIALTSGFNFYHSPKIFFRRLGLLLLVTLCFSIVISVIMPIYGQMFIGDRFRWVGVGTHPNHLGIAGAVGVWSALALYQIGDAAKDRLLAVLVLVVSFVAIIGANSVTSLIVASAMVFWFLFVGKSTNQKSIIIRAMLGVFVATILVLLVYILAPELLGLKALFGTVGRSENLTGRTELWGIAFKAIQERILFGWGYDSLISLGSRFGISYGQFHNGYLDLLVRGGAISLVLVIVMLVTGLVNGYRSWSHSPKIVITALGMCFFVILHNVTEASIVRPAHLLWLLLLTAVVALGLCNCERRKPRTQ
ncbi:MAG: O-antigen ligase family protein [Candidatus Thiodiazotropha endolucinida]